jgi:hypothetical protein
MSKTVGEIADEMRAAAADREQSSAVLASHFAETVEIRHVPPGAHDGPVPGSAIAAVAGREVAAVGRALPDAEHGESEITVEGDDIRVRGLTAGTLADGTRIEVRSNTVFTVAEGAIVGLRSEMDVDSAAQWGKVLAAGASG